jgi:hypothetical protein
MNHGPGAFALAAWDSDPDHHSSLRVSRDMKIFSEPTRKAPV